MSMCGESVGVPMCVVVRLGICFKRNNANRKRQSAKRPPEKRAKQGVRVKVAKPGVCC